MKDHIDNILGIAKIASATATFIGGFWVLMYFGPIIQHLPSHAFGELIIAVFGMGFFLLVYFTALIFTPSIALYSNEEVRNWFIHCSPASFFGITLKDPTIFGGSQVFLLGLLAKHQRIVLYGLIMVGLNLSLFNLAFIGQSEAFLISLDIANITMLTLTAIHLFTAEDIGRPRNYLTPIKLFAFSLFSTMLIPIFFFRDMSIYAFLISWVFFSFLVAIANLFLPIIFPTWATFYTFITDRVIPYFDHPLRVMMVPAVLALILLFFTFFIPEIIKAPFRALGIGQYEAYLIAKDKDDIEALSRAAKISPHHRFGRIEIPANIFYVKVLSSVGDEYYVEIKTKESGEVDKPGTNENTIDNYRFNISRDDGTLIRAGSKS